MQRQFSAARIEFEHANLLEQILGSTALVDPYVIYSQKGCIYSRKSDRPAQTPVTTESQDENEEEQVRRTPN